ncbi:MAG: GNAT family N-acetyltransferase [Planctomycetota bacterium]|jgi:RimJ/RimL family protein N-acetyltransferase
MQEPIPRDFEYSDGTVLIRPCRLDDAVMVYEGVRESIAEITPFLAWCHPDYSREDSRSYLELCQEAWKEGTEFGFTVLGEADQNLLGLCGINHINPIILYGNLGYWIRTSRIGQGAATRATKLLARFGFERLGLRRLEIVVDLHNPASLRVAEKTGAVREGIVRNRIRYREEFRDGVLFSLIPADPYGTKNQPNRNP